MSVGHVGVDMTMRYSILEAAALLAEPYFWLPGEQDRVEAARTRLGLHRLPRGGTVKT